MLVILFSITPSLHYSKVPCQPNTVFINVLGIFEQHPSFILDKSELTIKMRPWWLSLVDFSSGIDV